MSLQEPMVDVRMRRRVHDRLGRWYRRHRRNLPWRHNRDPYRIWISEIMLQQTQVATVVPYFERFLSAFPTVQALARASEEEVLRLWEGLGYYRRARHLHHAARILVSRYGGEFPDNAETLRHLPGIGRYTLGAILSQAFDQRWPILEANSRRVLCRLFGHRDDPRRGAGLRWLWQVAEDLLPARQTGEFNQALMELGALVCTPSTPRCPVCPLKDFCVAQRHSLQEQIPARVAPRRIVAMRELAVAVRRGGRVLLVQRPEGGRWAGLWEFPHGPLVGRESFAVAAQRILRQLTNLEAQVEPRRSTVRHSVTHHRIALAGCTARYRSGRFRSSFYRQGRWLRPDELHELPLSAPQRRLARLLLDPK